MNEEKEKVLSYLYSLKTKLKNFQTRAPVYFSFQNDVTNLYIQEIESVEILKFPIDYSIDVSDFIAVVRDRLRDEVYPRMEQVIIHEVEPSIEDINEEINKTQESFDEVYKRLKKKKEIKRYIIDKIDTVRNRVVLIDEKERNESFIYKLNMPVVVFLKRYARNGISDRELFKVFQKNSTFIKR